MSSAPVVRIGTSGWQYRDWRGAFYARHIPAAQWLPTYAETFTTVEANGTFYRLPEIETFASWKSSTPPDFEVSVKASRYLTHVRRLQDPSAAVERLLERARGLGSKLGPVLLQLPPTMHCDLGRLEATLSAFPPSVKVAVEFRHDSWITDATAALLSDHDVATCLADRRGVLQPIWKTAGWGYVRFHEGRAKPAPRYGRAALQSWAERIAELYQKGETVYAYFNNDTHACAPRNALEFAGACRSAGMSVPLNAAADAVGAA